MKVYCELITSERASADAVRQLLPSIVNVGPCDAVVMGAPVGCDRVNDSVQF